MKKQWLHLCVVLLCIGQGCRTKEPIASLAKPAEVLIGKNFTSQRLNQQLVVCTKLSAKDLTRKDLKAWVRKNAIAVSQKENAILLGSFRKYPEAWFYTQIINTNGTSQQLVVDEFNRLRCDDFEVFTSKHGSVKNWGSISRSTHFSKYPLPFFTYAVPITIEPKDTLNLLINSRRHYGAHEVNLNVSTYETYLSKHIVHFLSKIFQSIVFVICILMMLILGAIFRYKTMTYLGLYLSSLLYMHLTSWGFTDAMTNFTAIGLSGSNISTFGLFVSCAAAYPFLIEWMKVVPKNEKIFKAISYSMIGFNLFCVFCYLLPINLFNSVYASIDLPSLAVISALTTILWMLYCSILAIFRVKIYYMFIGVGVAFLPFLVQQLTNISSKPASVLLQVSHPTFILAAVGFTIISTYLLREKLISREKFETNLFAIRESLEEILKSEISVIGRNLHDQVGNTLASALGYLNMNEVKTETVKELILGSINELRMISHNLVKDDQRPLSEKVASLADRLNDLGITAFVFADFSQQKIDTLPKLTQQNLYAIIQELLTNILKHAQAQEVQLQFFDTEGTLRLIVEDDGVGFDTEQESGGIGLQNIHQRVALINGKITIDSTPQGTTTIIDLTK